MAELREDEVFRLIDLRTDVTDAEELKAAFDAAVSKFGAVDICINNAGIIDERVWEKMFAVNTVAQIRGSQLALDHMRRDRGGRGGLIINTVSVSGLVSDLIEGFMKMILDQDSTDVIFEVKKPAKGVFRKRQVVDSDGVSNPVTVD
nr:hypothetical protein BaRGS_027304 [Batillaria attramentaria]